MTMGVDGMTMDEFRCWLQEEHYVRLQQKSLKEIKSYVVGQLCPADVVWKFGEEVLLRCHPRYLTMLQNDVVCPKIALELLQNKTLM
ncbi:hypothetical protein AVEN_220170-1 [Araneus ventricosus]|uniref:Uncharacterized protein n=1 Tax=Araneus ventricosus TaxID=182803 RepID=A0A4Y2V062_ARAVE|nr:hypothetical protein AVEN_220170-1 [Araneus ventricosus]